MVGLDDAGDDVALDELALLLGGLAERRGGEAVYGKRCANPTWNGAKGALMLAG